MTLVNHVRRPRARAALAACSLLLAVVGSTSEARAEFPTLERAIQLARERAIVVAEAQAELGVANAQMAGAKASALGNPYSDIQVDRGIERSTEIQALSFTYFPIDIAGQRGKRIDEAEKLIQWRKLGIIDARAAATGEVVVAYGEVVVGAQRIVEAQTGEATARDEAKYFEGRYEARDTTIYERALADAEVARWMQSRVEAELRVTQARARFAQLTGSIDVERPPSGITLLPPNLRSPWNDGAIKAVIDRTPIIARLEAERTYWDSSIARYEREKIPPVSFEIIAGRGSTGETRLGGGAVITFPVTRRFQGEIARAEQGRAAAVRRAALHRTIIEARLRAARDALVNVRRGVEELDRSGIPALEQAVKASVDAFRAGKIDLSRAMLARRDLALARARRLDLIEAAWRAYADLVILSGEMP